MNLGKLGKIVEGANAYLAEAVLSGVRYKDSNIQASWDISYEMRRKLTKKYAWAIPTPEAIEAIKKYLPIIEIGAGKGYWASLIDGDIICFDKHAGRPEDNFHVDDTAGFYPVEEGSHEKIAEHPDRTLFLCWPPYDTPMAADCLREYGGTHLVFIGEGRGGCTAGDDFWKMIEDGWETIEDIGIPQWNGIHDWLTIYVRKD